MDAQPVTFWPRASRRMAISMSVSLLSASLLGWALTPAVIRDLFTPFQVVTLLFFIAVMIGMMVALGFGYVRADAEGLRFRNGVRTHQLPWADIKAFRYRSGDPWPFVLVRGPVEQLALMGIQRTDGPRADEVVAELRRRLEEAYADPDGSPEAGGANAEVEGDN